MPKSKTLEGPLSEPMRYIVRRYDDGASVKTIAKETGFGVSTVYRKLVQLREAGRIG